MVFLAALIHLPRNYLLVVCCVVIFGHNLLDSIHFENNFFWSLIHERKRFELSGHTFGAGYPMIPWVAVMALGFWFGSFYDKGFDPIKRRKTFNTIGICSLLLMIVLRFTNVYGNLLPWKHYNTATQNIFSFLNLSKYPPSLSFLLLTLGATLLFLANTENLKGRVVSFFCVFGRVPFFYYITHIYLIHFLALLVAVFTGFGWEKMILPQLPFRVEALRGFGYSLITVYLIWIGLVAILYPLCKAFDRYKQNHKDKWWLSYL